MQRYHKALLLMEGLQPLLTDRADVENIAKCECRGASPAGAGRGGQHGPTDRVSLATGKLCIERRLSALLSGIGA